MYSIIRTTNQFMRMNVAKQIVRDKRSMPRKRRFIDPGIQRRKEIVNDNQGLEELNDYDFDLEADFMSVGKSHQQHEEEQLLKLEQQKYHIVRQKYFKQKLPNFLTWSDKEQIRYLHSTNPEEWTIEKLSEGFPALPDVIAKITKAAWTKDSEHKIHKHDESVKNNWKMFKEGKLEALPSHLVEHLQKFTNRELSSKPFEIPSEFKSTTTKSLIAPNIKIGTEFSEIISSYKRLKNKGDNDKIKDDFNFTNKNSKVQKAPKTDTYVLNDKTRINRRHTTLSSFKEKIEKLDREGKALVEEKIILDALKEEKLTENTERSIQPVVQVDQLDKYPSSKNSTVITKFDENRKQLMDYPEKIIIPKNKFKRGYTYKLNDCYYDDDGEFLYRVPGMYK
ncbi:hypothetical protein ILUMI_06133 [Ignelater luminosus]|uniref:Neugrin n=1 Tax=Ignelater luminosus TaxID=2038154 RepID=A0A8K0D940_IGNLU|nr:hypothetical protein ILUMI_06133 [Ignelater luminosus]